MNVGQPICLAGDGRKDGVLGGNIQRLRGAARSRMRHSLNSPPRFEEKTISFPSAVQARPPRTGGRKSSDEAGHRWPVQQKCHQRGNLLRRHRRAICHLARESDRRDKNLEGTPPPSFGRPPPREEKCWREGPAPTFCPRQSDPGRQETSPYIGQKRSFPCLLRQSCVRLPPRRG